MAIQTPDAKTPSTVRVVWLMSALMFRRAMNSGLGAKPARSREASGSGARRRRTGTMRKTRPSVFSRLLQWLFVAMMAFGVFMMSSMVVGRFASIALFVAPAEAVDSSDPRPTDELETDEVLRDREESPEDDADSEGPAVGVVEGAALRSFDAGVGRFRPMPVGGAATAMTTAFALLLHVVACAAMFLAVGAGARGGSAKADVLLEWGFSFPVPTRRLLISRWLGYAVTFPQPVFVVAALLFWIQVRSGRPGETASAFAVGASVALGLSIAALRLATQTWLRVSASVRLTNWLVALSVLLGSALLFGGLWVALGPVVPSWFLSAVESSPANIAFSPFGVASLCISPDVSLGVAVSWVAGWCGVLVVVGLTFSTWLLRDGFESSGSEAAGSKRLARGRGAKSSGGAGTLGTFGKSLRMLVRDRALLVQTFVVPLLIVGFQLVMNPHWISASQGDERVAGMVACGIGCYVSLLVGRAVVDGERTTFWLRFTFPQSVARGFLEATFVPLCIVWTYVLVVFFAFGRFQSFEIGILPPLATVLAGTAVVLSISVGNSLTFVDPLVDSKRSPPKGVVANAYLLLGAAGLLTYSLREGDGWTWLVTILLIVVVSLGVWQRAELRLPYAMDPVSLPPPSILMLDGAVAAYFFYGVKGLIASLAENAEVSGGVVAFVYAMSATSIMAGFWIVVAIRGMSMRWALTWPPGTYRFGLGPGVGAAAIGGVCGGVALGFMHWTGGSSVLVESYGGHGLIAWTVWFVLSPVIEEVLFRGALFRPLRSTWGLRAATLLSATVFAVMHDKALWVPMMGLGVVTALVYERTHQIRVPILVHASFNVVAFAAGGAF